MKAYDMGQKIPDLVIKLSAKTLDIPEAGNWGSSFDESIVHVKRVVAYWLRTFKGAERRYTTTKREALGAKEGLVKFQPFIKGEDVLLVTDHAVLQWACTYENANR